MHDGRNLGWRASLALVPLSAPVSYLGSRDLNLAFAAPGEGRSGWSQATVHSPGTDLDYAGDGLTPWRDCGLVSVPATLLILDSGWIADYCIADA